MAEFFGELPPRERVKRYRLLAAEAYARAQGAADATSRAQYLTIANGWHALAVEAEHAAELTLPDAATPLQDDA
jgi:hypothetical protein